MMQIKYTRSESFYINSEEQAEKFLRYFNSFHDGFIKRIILESNDYFTQDDEQDFMSRAQVISNEVMLKLDIAHYNYGVGELPVNRHVCLLFRDFYDVNIGVKISTQTDWTINEIKINRISRPLDTDPNFSMKIFELILERPVYDQVTGWSYLQESLLKFTEAVAWEEDWNIKNFNA